MNEIVGFICEWGGYAAADLAGYRGIHYPANLRTVRVECTGRVDPVWLLDPLIEGAGGVIVIGCMEGDSRHEIGNFRADERVRWVQKALAMTGEEPGRVRVLFVSSEDPQRFADAVKDFGTDLQSYGPIARDEEHLERLRTLQEVFSSEKVRWLIGRGPNIVAEGDVFGQPVAAEEFDREVEQILAAEYRRVRISRSLKDEAHSVVEVAARVGLTEREVMREISDLIGIGRVALEGHADPPVFRAVVR